MTSVEVCDICGKTANQYIIYNNIKRCDECYDKFMQTTYDPVEQRIRQLELDVNMLKAAVGRSDPFYPTFTTCGYFTPNANIRKSDDEIKEQEQLAILLTERGIYLDLLDEAFGQLCSTQMDDDGCDDGTGNAWMDDNESSMLRSIADALVKAGRLEWHPSAKRLYRRIK